MTTSSASRSRIPLMPGILRLRLRADAGRGAFLGPPDAALDRVDEVGAQRRGRDDPVDRADVHGARDAVDGVELAGELAELLRPDPDPARLALRAQPAALGTVLGGGDALVELGDRRMRAGAEVHIAREHH